MTGPNGPAPETAGVKGRVLKFILGKRLAAERQGCKLRAAPTLHSESSDQPANPKKRPKLPIGLFFPTGLVINMSLPAIILRQVDGCGILIFLPKSILFEVHECPRLSA